MAPSRHLVGHRSSFAPHRLRVLIGQSRDAPARLDMHPPARIDEFDQRNQ